jgi:hypothetical protein
LIFNMQRSCACRFIVTDSAIHIHGIPIASVGITDERDTHSSSNIANILDHLSHRQEPDIGKPFVERYQFVASCGSECQSFIEGQSSCGAAVLQVAPVTREVYEDAAHQLCRNCEKVGAILPAHAAGIDQPQISFINQSRSL